MIEKTIYKAFFPNLYKNIISEIRMISENRFLVITSYHNKLKSNLIIEKLNKMKFSDNNIIICKRFVSKIDAWICIKYTIAFTDFSYTQYK